MEEQETEAKALKRFSTLQRVEIAEIGLRVGGYGAPKVFQYSSTSRNC